ncbi:Glutamate decarboxylase 2 [Tupaia chinensis]|uniref:glutamate decarboxylase n=1 Tax=Tupaia chinensis TaxID=246437 RepID=L9LGG3_TUPCH|nr:Glutamate decarboxylase 2 [Tupaia chinensis]
MSIMSYNGGAIMAMKGKSYVAIAADRRFGIQVQMVTTDFQKIFPMGDRLNGLAYYTETVIAGLDPKTFKPFICCLDLIGCPMVTDDFVVSGTCSEQMYGMCESLWEPIMDPEYLFETISQAMLNAVDWDAVSGMGVIVHGLMQSCNQMHASYLFQQDKHYDLSYDTGDKALQCGRHVDVFKLWLMWRAKGTTGFEAHIDKCLELAEYLYNIIKNREGYEMVFDGKPQHTNVCFWYIPPSLRTLEDNEERMSRLSKVAPVIKARMMEYGTTMVSYQPLGDKVNFFRMVISNPAATHQDIDFLIEEIERLGQDL